MQAISPTVFTVSPEEKDILIELLEREQSNLPVEIHHTRTARFRELLKQRLQLIDGLMGRLRTD